MARAVHELTEEERRRLRRANERLRTASQELQSLVATDPIKNRWPPEPAPAEILDAARDELQTAWNELMRGYGELLGWEPPS